LTNSQKSYVLAAITVAFWSTVATAFKIALTHLDLFQLLFLATLTAATVLLIPVVWNKHTSLLLAEVRAFPMRSFLVAAMNPLIYYLVLFAAYDRLPAQIAQPVNYTWALMLVLLSIIFLGQKPTKYDLVACVVSYAGVFVIATQGDFSFQGTDPLGLMLALASTVIWAGYWIVNMQDPRDERVSMCLNFFVAIPITGIACLMFSSFEFSTNGIIAAAYIGIFEMGLAFLLWSQALKLAENTSRVSTMIFISPFLSLVLIYFILGEPIHVTTYIGLVVIVSGLLIQRIPATARESS
jgi:drug/metabolite transporter (DMT)-like permease